MTEMTYLDWVETAAFGNLKDRLDTGDLLLAQANTLLQLLLVGIGGALAYAMRLAEPGVAGAAAWGTAAVAAWLMGVAAVLTVRCIATRNTPALYNEPKNLHQPDQGWELQVVREYELENLQARIEQAKLRNGDVATWLDRCRYATVATPVWFVIVWAWAGR